MLFAAACAGRAGVWLIYESESQAESASLMQKTERIVGVGSRKQFLLCLNYFEKTTKIYKRHIDEVCKDRIVAGCLVACCLFLCKGKGEHLLM